MQQRFYLGVGHLVVLDLVLRFVGCVRGDGNGLRGFRHDVCDPELFLAEYLVHLAVGGSLRLGSDLRAAGVGYHGHRLYLRSDEVLVEFLHRLVEGDLLPVKAYPVVVVWGDTVGAPEYVADIVLLQPHALKDRLRERSAVLENAAGEHVVDIRNIQGTVYSGYHQLLEFGDDGIAHLLVLGNYVIRHRGVGFPDREFHGQRHFECAVVNYTVSVRLDNISHMCTP